MKIIEINIEFIYFFMQNGHINFSIRLRKLFNSKLSIFTHFTMVQTFPSKSDIPFGHPPSETHKSNMENETWYYDCGVNIDHH